MDWFKSDFLRKPADLVLGFYEIGSWPALRVQFFQTLFEIQKNHDDTFWYLQVWL